MKRMKFFLMTLVFLCASSAIFAQSIKVSGVVKDQNGTPLPGVSVFIDGTTVGTVTDVNGNYSLNVPGDATLLVSYIGMESQMFNVNNRAVINVELNESTTALDEVMVVAYGTAKKASFTGSAEMVKAKQIERRTVSNVSKAIEGTVAGVITTSGGGQPGSGNSIRIRGFGSLNASSSPLYVVDGIPYDGSVSSINPNDIESISILKDAASASLYGSRASNGVVIITTKRGKAGEAVVNFKANWGISSRAIPDYKRVNAKQYLELAYESRKNLYLDNGYDEATAAQGALNGYFNAFGGEQFNPFYASLDQLIDPSTGKFAGPDGMKWNDDWTKEILANNPLRQDYQFSVTGGTDKTQYLMSLGYLDEEGLAKTTKFERYNARVSVDSQVKEWIKAGINTSFSQRDQNFLMNEGSYYGNVWYSAMSMGPVYPIYQYDAEGHPILDAEGNKIFDISSRPFDKNSNIVGRLFKDKRSFKSNSTNSNMYVKFGTQNDAYGWLKDFSLTLNLGVNYDNSKQREFYTPEFGDGQSKGGELEVDALNTLSLTFNQLLNWNHQFGRSNFDVMAGHEFYSLRDESLYGYKTGGNTMELASFATVAGTGSSIDNYRIESYFGRINYNLDEKYFLSGSYRRDGSSRFEHDNRWGDFWSVGAAWILSNESWMENVNWVNSATLKASYGTQGNDMLSTYYAWQSFYDYYPNATMPGAWKTSVENKSLKWEKSGSFNVGLEARLFDRVNFSFEWYNKKTFDLILSKPMPLASGYTSYLDNVGDMKNVGFDATIGVEIFRSDNFQWTSTIMASRVKNEITALTDGSDQIVQGSYIQKVGQPLNTYYMPYFLGVNTHTGEAEYAMFDDNGEQLFNGDGTPMVTTDYNTATLMRHMAGSRIPDLYGSWNNEFRWKNFDLSVLLTYGIGGKMADSKYFSLMETRNYGQAFHVDLLNRWQKDGDVTDVPRFKMADYKVYSDHFLHDASYLSIKNITLGYTLPQSWLQKAKINKARIFATADNIFTFSSLRGADPQETFSGGNDYSYTPIRVFSLGVDLKF